jgi:hypothetical protein
MDPVLLPLREALLALTFCIRVQDGQRLFLNFRDSLEPMPFYTQEIIRGHSHVFSGHKMPH